MKSKPKAKQKKPPIRRFSRIDWSSLLCLFGLGDSFLLPRRDLRVSLKWGMESFLDDGLDIQPPLSDKESPSLDGLW